MLRFKLLLLAVTTVICFALQGAGIGGITVFSAEGKPLYAKIKVVLDPSEDYEVVGKTQAGRVLHTGWEGGDLVVRSSSPVVENPFNLSLEIKSASGRLIKNFVVVQLPHTGVDVEAEPLQTSTEIQNLPVSKRAATAEAPAKVSKKTKTSQVKSATQTKQRVATSLKKETEIVQRAKPKNKDSSTLEAILEKLNKLQEAVAGLTAARSVATSGGTSMANTELSLSYDMGLQPIPDAPKPTVKPKIVKSDQKAVEAVAAPAADTSDTEAKVGWIFVVLAALIGMGLVHGILIFKVLRPATSKVTLQVNRPSRDKEYPLPPVGLGSAKGPEPKITPTEDLSPSPGPAAAPTAQATAQPEVIIERIEVPINIPVKVSVDEVINLLVKEGAESKEVLDLLMPYNSDEVMASLREAMSEHGVTKDLRTKPEAPKVVAPPIQAQDDNDAISTIETPSAGDKIKTDPVSSEDHHIIEFLMETPQLGKAEDRPVSLTLENEVKGVGEEGLGLPALDLNFEEPGEVCGDDAKGKLAKAKELAQAGKVAEAIQVYAEVMGDPGYGDQAKEAISQLSRIG